LHEEGIKIHLHCFQYGLRASEVLASYCKSVSYYQRKAGISNQISLKPYIVFSRRSKELLEKLKSDDHPVFFDGLHTTLYLDHPDLAGRRKIVRTHNIEHRYYRSLAKMEKNILKKLYFLVESYRLRLYEKKLQKADLILPISVPDMEYFQLNYTNLKLLPPFIPFNNIVSQTGKGDYVLFHGNLSVNENISLAKFLTLEVFQKIPYKCIIAGKNPPGNLISLISSFKNITIIPDPDEGHMLELIKDAHINIIPAVNSDGFKLKLLFSLFAGRFCVTSSAMVKGTMLDTLCEIADDGPSYIERIESLMRNSFTAEMISARERILIKKYCYAGNGKYLSSLIFND